MNDSQAGAVPGGSYGRTRGIARTGVKGQGQERTRRCRAEMEPGKVGTVKSITRKHEVKTEQGTDRTEHGQSQDSTRQRQGPGPIQGSTRVRPEQD